MADHVKPQAGEVLEMLAHAVQEHLEDRKVDPESIRTIAREVATEEVSKARLPRPIAVSINGVATATLNERVHCQFEELLALVAEGHVNVLMVGPAGCGKTSLAKHLALALGRQFAFISLSVGVTESHLLGRTLPQPDGSWKFVPSRFVEVYEQGGVFLLDEMDAADANVMVAINAALANGVLVTVDGTVHHRHADCIILSAANTWGRGGDLMYVGRNPLDASTLDRFILSTLFVQYDEALEVDIAAPIAAETARKALLEWVWGLRAKIARNKLRRVASTRLVVNGTKALLAGRTLGAIQDRFFQDWSTDERAKVA